ncbi:MAG: VCBS repeat-containing protein, partial [Bacteroidota bacterium]
MKKLHLIIFLLALQNTLQAQVLFTPTKNTIEESYNFTYVIAGDLDGDGRDEILATSRRKDISRIHLYDVSQEGDISLMQEFEVVDNTHLPNIADADNDNDMDIIWATVDQVSYFENDGSGNFSTEEQFFLPFAGEIYFMDFDNDGDRDIITSTFSGYQLLENNNGSYTFNQDIDLQAESRYLSFVDLDNDNDLDIVSIQNTGSEIRFSYNENGTYTSSILAAPILDDYNPARIEVGDLNNDGFVDMAYTSNNSYECIIAYNAGDNLDFSDTTRVYFAPRKGGSDIRFIDIDNDDDLDVFLGSSSRTTTVHLTAWLKNLTANLGDIKRTP